MQKFMCATSNGDPYKELWKQLWKTKVPGTLNK